MMALIEYYGKALTKGKFTLVSFALQPLSFIFIVYVVSGGRFLDRALAGAIVSFITGVGIADLSIELVGMKARSKFYDVVMSLPGGNWRKALGISIGMSIPALPYVTLLFFLLSWRLGLRAIPGIMFGIVSLWLWSAGIGFFMGVKIREPLTVMRFSNLTVTALTVFPPVYYPNSVLPEKLAAVMNLLPTVSAARLMTGESGSAFLISIFWAVFGVFLLLKFRGLEG
ncbi:multidrug transporter [Thermococcus alcaliphilus]|uniref:multidrug transporter n=1 Tax=Thermococcus alcaliphilus TaxID=139207 RepID=UPI00209197B5|nr:multidrug transporter [Thermococcus alcaliphilus]MCO6040731.1 multidrug transporter [Thermococcus alcaliphilus]